MTLFHGCILQDPTGYQPDSFRTVVTGFGSGRVHLILAKPNDSDLLVLQAIKYPKDWWTDQRAQFACDARNGEFIPASEEASGESLEETFEDVFFSEEQVGRLIAGAEISVQELETAMIEPTELTELSNLDGVEDGNFFHLGQQLLGVEERDGLIWKQLLVTGSWPGNEFIPPLVITNDMLAQIKEAFDAGVITHVDVPDGHTNSTLANTGFVRAVEIRADEDPQTLWVGIEFTESVVKDKVLHGTIANVSAGLEKGFTDPTTGKSWPWVLWHVALTNKPVLKDLQPFIAASLNGLDLRVYRHQALSQTDTPTEKPREQRKEIEQMDRDQNLDTDPVEDQETADTGASTEEAKITLSQEDLDKLRDEERQKIRRELELESNTAIQELRQQAETATALAQDSQRQLHAQDVRVLLRALGGHGEHERVRLPHNTAFAPSIVKVVQPLLEIDIGAKAVVKLSQDGAENQKSLTDIVMDILNSVAEAGDGVMVELDVAKGIQSHTPPSSEDGPTQEDKASAVDAYLEQRGLSLVGAQEE